MAQQNSRKKPFRMVLWRAAKVSDQFLFGHQGTVAAIRLLLLLKFSKAGRVSCGGARETHWATCHNGVTPSKTKEFFKSSCFFEISMVVITYYSHINQVNRSTYRDKWLLYHNYAVNASIRLSASRKSHLHPKNSSQKCSSKRFGNAFWSSEESFLIFLSRTFDMNTGNMSPHIGSRFLFRFLFRDTETKLGF